MTKKGHRERFIGSGKVGDQGGGGIPFPIGAPGMCPKHNLPMNPTKGMCVRCRKKRRK